MRYLKLTILLFFIGTGVAGAKDNHDQAILNQFEKQCTDATDNKNMCKCAVKAFKKSVPPDAASWADHPSEHVDTKVVTIPEEFLAVLAEDVAACEAANPK